MSHPTSDDGSQCLNIFAVPQGFEPGREHARRRSFVPTTPPHSLPTRISSVSGGTPKCNPWPQLPRRMLAQLPPRNMEIYYDNSSIPSPPPPPMNIYMNPLLIQRNHPDTLRGYWYPPNLVPGWNIPVPLSDMGTHSQQHSRCPPYQQIPAEVFLPDDSSSDTGSLDGLSQALRAVRPRPSDRPHLPPPRTNDNPLNEFGGDYDWPALAPINQEILGPQRIAAWEIRRSDIERQSPLGLRSRITMEEYLTHERGDRVPFFRNTVMTLNARAFANCE
ncbi:hypothetical protein EV421DRAFT_1911687 [Armillaria borealis]|uniref:Uncharacterized protein n=1 Tax=Armillaria borealis TaxID=47425 RepID=A0AA39MF92_9AGAR|nr:hypothetical protein EV421DRAFT_1911687 [Armillaria borealis]